MKIENPTFEQAVALVSEDLGAIYVAEYDNNFPVEYKIVTLTGSKMKGFLLPSDTLVSIERWC